jgi:hypothetical protein
MLENRGTYVFANNLWEMLLKAIRQLLFTAKRVQEAILKGYRKAAGNAQIPLSVNKREGTIAQRQSAKNIAIFVHFLLNAAFLFKFIKTQRHIKKF